MSTVWVVVIVVAVVVIAAVVVMRRSRGEPGEVRERAEIAAEKPVEVEEEERAVAPKAARTPEKVTAEETEPVREARPSAQPGEERPEPLEGTGVGTGTETAEVEEERAEEPRPPSAEEIRERVESQLDDAGRMLTELKEAVEGKEGEAPVDASMLAILEEGLQEVRSLLEKKRLDQARDKGEALHSQLALFLQTARRERSS